LEQVAANFGMWLDDSLRTARKQAHARRRRAVTRPHS
jgi:hypothetical protein